MSHKTVSFDILIILFIFTVNQCCGLKLRDLKFTNVKGNFKYAQSLCKSLGMTIVRIESDNDNLIVNNAAILKNSDHFWIDGNSIQEKTKWLNSDNESLVYTKWGTGQPNNWNSIEFCIEAHEDLYWNDIDCNTKNSIICGKEEIRLKSSDLHFTNSKGDFTFAQSLCKSRGMTIVRIDNERDNILVNDLAVLQDVGHFWVDGNSKETKTEWVNSDNGKLLFMNWYYGQPDNWSKNEFCIEVHEDLFWNDIDCSTRNAIICSKVKAKKIVDTTNILLLPLRGKATYLDGISQCKAQNSEMVTIDSDEMNKLVYDFAIEKNLGHYWIDMNDIAKEGRWVTSNKGAVQYQNFAPGYPGKFRKGHCVIVAKLKNMYWYDADCNQSSEVICLKFLNTKVNMK